MTPITTMHLNLSIVSVNAHLLFPCLYIPTQTVLNYLLSINLPHALMHAFLICTAGIISIYMFTFRNMYIKNEQTPHLQWGCMIKLTNKKVFVPLLYRSSTVQCYFNILCANVYLWIFKTTDRSIFQAVTVMLPPEKGCPFLNIIIKVRLEKKHKKSLTLVLGENWFIYL